MIVTAEPDRGRETFRGGLTVRLPRGFPMDCVVALIGLGSLAFVAFPTLGPVKLSDLILPGIALRSLGRRPVRFPKSLFAILAVVLGGAGIGATGAGAPQVDVIGAWATGLESPRIYAVITAFRVATTAIACFDIVSVVAAHRRHMEPVLRWLLLSHLILSIGLYVAGPGRDVSLR